MNISFSHIPLLDGVDSAELTHWTERQRWFGGKARSVLSWSLLHTKTVGNFVLLALQATYADGWEVYSLPVGWADDAPPETVIFRKDGRVLCDATVLPEFREWLFSALEPKGITQKFFSEGTVPESRVLKAEQSNTSLIYGDKLFIKWYRRLVEGKNPDAEVTQFLAETAGFPNVPAFSGALSWNGASLALATALTPNEGDAWPLALAAAREFYATGDSGEWLHRAALLGKRTGELHTALAAATDEDFAPEALAAADLAELCGELARLERINRTVLAERLATLPPAVAVLASRYLAEPASIPAPQLPVGAVKIRTHGDYHLGQVLWTGSDFVIIDFEGEPSRTLAERRAKRSPLRDVAGMLRSFHYAAHAAGPHDAAENWAADSQFAFLEAWKTAAPRLLDGLSLLPLFIAEKALYELSYELNNRPDWVHIPLKAVAAAD